MKSHAVVCLLVTVNLMSLSLAGPGITGLSGGLDALLGALGTDKCATHQCSVGIVNCLANCGNFRRDCANKANLTSKQGKLWTCILERSTGANCFHATVKGFIESGKCTVKPEEFVQ